MKTRTRFVFRIDTWTPDGESIVAPRPASRTSSSHSPNIAPPANAGQDPSFDLIRHQRANESRAERDDLRRDPLQVRKATLASIVAKARRGIWFNEHIEGVGPTIFAHAYKLALEGIVSKRKDSPMGLK